MARDHRSAKGLTITNSREDDNAGVRRSKFRRRKVTGFKDATRFEWLKAIMSDRGPPHPMTRFVLLALSLHMHSDGNSCFPSMALLARESNLSLRTVKTHMAEAFEDGWLHRYERKGPVSGYSRYEYEATIPEHGALNAPLD